MSRATPPGQPDGRDGITPDAWLREALRHAPDTDVTVPAAVRETILRQARAAVHTTSHDNVRENAQPDVPAPQGGTWRRWVDGWLRPTRLGYSGAFVMLLVVGIWGLEGLDEQARGPLAPPRPEVTIADAAPAGAASAPTPATVSPAADAPAPIVAAAPAKPERQAPAAPAGVRPPAATRAANEAATKSTRESASSDTAAAPVLSEQAVTPSASPKPAPAPAPAPAPSPLPAPASPAPATAPPIVAKRATASDAGTQAPVMEAAAPAAARGTAAAPTMPAVAPHATPPGTGTSLLKAQQDRAGAVALDPLASLRQRATEDGSLRWSVGAREGSVGATQRAWLDALRTTTAGRWTRASAAPAAQTVQLSSNAGPLASLSADGTPGTLWVVIGASVYRAPLSTEALAKFEEARSGW